MYRQPKKSMEELTEKRKELTQKIINSQDLGYVAVEKLKEQLARNYQEIWEARLNEEDGKEVGNG